MAVPAGDCDSGYYCPGGAVSRREVICPVGHYCEQGSAQPTPCPSGTMSNELGNPNITYCDLCTAGYYCSGTNNTNVTGQCLTIVTSALFYSSLALSIFSFVLYCCKTFLWKPCLWIAENTLSLDCLQDPVMRDGIARLDSLNLHRWSIIVQWDIIVQ